MGYYIFKVDVCCFFLLFFLMACNYSKPGNTSNKTVYIKSQNGKYTLYRNGQPFFVKGASGFTNLKRLKEAGGNTIRVWDTVHLGKILDSAQANNLAVIVGLPLPPNENMDEFYNNTSKTNSNYKNVTALVNKYKNHPALLCWCLGNEIPFPYRPRFNNFYKAFNDIVDMIHKDDPNHPVTTSLMNFQTKNITNIKLRTNIDFISFNLFGGIQTLNKDLKDFEWFWKGPFLLTEWGIEGPWTVGNAWGAFIEKSSDEKAREYLQTYQKYMPVNNPRFMGSLVFYWGQKQECTPTWYSLFDENGNETDAVNTMQYIWTGKQLPYYAPAVKYMLVNNKKGQDNILFNPNTTANAKVYINGTDTDKLVFKWQLFKEDWFKPNGIFSEKKPSEIENAIIADMGTTVKFKAPAKEGPYRLLVYVYNSKGYFATANTPFYVISTP